MRYISRRSRFMIDVSMQDRFHGKILNMKRANMTIGILAHVDAGKTTLSESILYATGAIRRHGRVDHGDAFLDTDALERKRGITIFSKLARFSLDGRQMTLLDTPGHVDFSPEMERTLRVLDAAILVISAAEGVNPQVRVLWKLLQHYAVLTFIFVNKMDQIETGNPEHDQYEKETLISNIQRELGSGVVEFGRAQLSPANTESVAVCDERLMERVLEGGEVTREDVTSLVASRRLFPLYTGAALTDRGTRDLLEGIARYTRMRPAPDAFGAIVYKVTREQGGAGARLVWMKLTGGEIAVRDGITEINHEKAVAPPDADAPQAEMESDTVEEKISGIRLYSGERYEAVTRAQAGEIVAVTGLSAARTGDGLGFEESHTEELLSPIMAVRVIPDPGTDNFTLMRALRGIEEEEPMLHVLLDEDTKDVTVEIMGQVQIQILQNLLQERYGLSVTFGPGTIVYKETIRKSVEGVGHFEPLRHYAEVHLLLEPTGTGSGLTFENRCPPGTLDRNWQNLIMTHLQERTHKGVLTGSDITDMRISLIGGRASKKHTVGGDFRKATYSAVRQGLMMAQNILLEPVLSFRMELPKENLGRALNDISAMNGKAEPAVFADEMTILEGTVPASELSDYAQTLAGYTGGRGSLSVSLKDYEPCHNAKEVLDASAYDPDVDKRNPSWSVFCSHGAGTVVLWPYVRRHMHVETGWEPEPDDPNVRYLTDDYYTFAAKEEEEAILDDGQTEATSHERSARRKPQDFAERARAFEVGEKELMAIFEATYGPVQPRLHHPDNEKYYGDVPEENEIKGPAGGDPKYAQKAAKAAVGEQLREYLLVDGYNIIFAWSELRKLAAGDIKAARDRLLDILSNYAGYARETVIVVFDAYKVPGGRGEVYHQNDIDVVYTKEAETADLYIEKTAHVLGRKHRVTVATSDAVEQVIIFGTGAIRLSARGLLERILMTEQEMHEKFISDQA